MIDGMRVVIIGAGQVGTAIAEELAEAHDVVVLDTDPERVEALQYELDVLTLVGDGTSLPDLEEAGSGKADLFLSCTDDDRANLVACGTAKTLGEPFTIARTKSIQYLTTWERDQTAFDADFVVCSDLLTAENIVRVLGLPAAIDVDPFAGGIVQMAVFEISNEGAITGQTIAEADRFESLTFAGLLRDGEMIIPTGETTIRAGDRTVVIGSPQSVQQFAIDLSLEDTPDSADDIVIVGGSEVGYHTARLLEERGLKPQLIEHDHDRARQLAEELPETVVMEHDPTDTEFLLRKHVDKADTVVVTLKSDEETLLSGVLAKRIGCDRVVTTVESGEYVTLFEEIGIDVAINPRQVTAEEILRFSFTSPAENISVVKHNQAEVLEIELEEGSDLIGRPIEKLDADISGKFVIGAIARDREYVIPRGDTELQAGDNIVVFVETPAVNEWTELA
jgi:trk system potassium uptake protein TrkA